MIRVNIIKHFGLRAVCMLVGLLAGMVLVNAQSFKAYKIKPAKHYWGGYNIYFDTFTNQGDAEFDACAEALKESFSKGYGGGSGWSQEIYNIVDLKGDADIIVSGSYLFSPEEIMEVDEKLKTESGTQFPLKYTVNSYRQINRVDFTLELSVSDKEGNKIESFQLKDSLISKAKSEVRLPRIRYTLDELKAKLLERTPGYMHGKYCIFTSEVWVKFLKLKVKDKALKEEYKLVKDYLNNQDYIEAGKIFKKIYESQKAPEAAFNTAMCYEFAGDFSKAEEYYKIKFDFPSKLRMKENMKVWDSLPEAYKNSLETF